MHDPSEAVAGLDYVAAWLFAGGSKGREAEPMIQLVARSLSGSARADAYVGFRLGPFWLQSTTEMGRGSVVIYSRSASRANCPYVKKESGVALANLYVGDPLGHCCDGAFSSVQISLSLFVFF